MLVTWRKGTIGALLTILLSLPILVHAASRDQYGRYHALVIGNDDYAHLAKLDTAVSDAIATAGLLRSKYGFDVTLLLNATQSQTLNFIDWLKGELTDKDRLLIYYAGHGKQDPETGSCHWLPVDAKPKIGATWIASDNLSLQLRTMAARHVMVVADSCYSGTSAQAAKVPPKSAAAREEWLRNIAKKRSRTAMVSGALKPMHDTVKGGHSVFAKAFLDVLGDNGGILDGQTLFQQMLGKVPPNARRTLRYSDIGQAEQAGGDFLFVPRGLARIAEKKPVEKPVEKPVVASADAGKTPPVASADTSQMELAFWNSVKDSHEPAMFRAYLNKYPKGLFAELAGLRLLSLKPKQTASLAPAIVLEPIEGTYIAVRNANVRKAPNVSAEKVATLIKGSEIYVPGKVAGKNWMAVVRDGKRLGYVFSNLLQDKEALEAANAEKTRLKVEAAKAEVARVKVEAARIEEASQRAAAEAAAKKARRQAAFAAARAAEQLKKAEYKAWKAAASNGGLKALHSYLKKYPGSRNSKLARARIERLKSAARAKASRAKKARAARLAKKPKLPILMTVTGPAPAP